MKLATYTPEFPAEAVKLVLAQGLTLEEAAKRIAIPKDLKAEERVELTKLVRSRRTPQALALRARIVLKTADGERPSAIAQD